MQAKPGFTTDLHSSLQKPLITQLYLCNSKDRIPFPFPYSLLHAGKPSPWKAAERRAVHINWDQPFAVGPEGSPMREQWLAQLLHAQMC